jgi:glycosyltransferase involved in cell wall biosynthesis
MPNIKLLIKNGYQVDVACNFKKGNACSNEEVLILKEQLKNLDVNYYQIDFERDVKKLFKNGKAYFQVLDLVKKNNYSFIHCHTPIGGVCGRLAGKTTGTKVIYTAHGFHFYKGAPIKNWLLYYPVEKILAYYTDILITINREDYQLAKRFKAKKIVYVPGVGINTNKFNCLEVDIDQKRKKLGLNKDDFVILSVGELSKRKNQEVIIEALSKLKNPQIKYLICGQGDLQEFLINKAEELNVNVEFLGFREDIPEICAITDLFAFPSSQEGLPVALMEAMAAGLPVVCSKIRGNTDLVEDGKGGYLVDSNDSDGFANAIKKLYKNIDKRHNMGSYNAQSVKKFDSSEVMYRMNEVYNEIEDTNKK